jgi:hypothetical protein
LDAYLSLFQLQRKTNKPPTKNGLRVKGLKAVSIKRGKRGEGVWLGHTKQHLGNPKGGRTL